MEFKDQKIIEFIGDLSSSMSSPGGGSVAALVSAIAGSLNSMVYSLSINKKAFEELDTETKGFVLGFKEASTKFTLKALNLMEKDKEYFNKLMESYKMPKNTDKEKENRDKAIKEKTLKAMQAPLELARVSYDFYDNIDVALRYGNKMIISDASCAAICLHAAIECAIVNVKVNLNSFRGKDFVEEIEAELENLAFNSFSRKNIICNMVEEVIYPD